VVSFPKSGRTAGDLAVTGWFLDAIVRPMLIGVPGWMDHGPFADAGLCSMNIEGLESDAILAGKVDRGAVRQSLIAPS
jgi:hypothetical protein